MPERAVSTSVRPEISSARVARTAVNTKPMTNDTMIRNPADEGQNALSRFHAAFARPPRHRGREESCHATAGRRRLRVEKDADRPDQERQPDPERVAERAGSHPGRRVCPPRWPARDSCCSQGTRSTASARSGRWRKTPGKPRTLIEPAAAKERQRGSTTSTLPAGFHQPRDQRVMVCWITYQTRGSMKTALNRVKGQSKRAQITAGLPGGGRPDPSAAVRQADTILRFVTRTPTADSAQSLRAAYHIPAWREVGRDANPIVIRTRPAPCRVYFATRSCGSASDWGMVEFNRTSFSSSA